MGLTQIPLKRAACSGGAGGNSRVPPADRTCLTPAAPPTHTHTHPPHSPRTHQAAGRCAMHQPYCGLALELLALPQPDGWADSRERSSAEIR